MSSKEAITEEREDIYFKDIKEKLSDVHISVIEVSQALQGRKYEEAKNKVSCPPLRKLKPFLFRGEGTRMYYRC